jgi:hypothetical protein
MSMDSRRFDARDYDHRSSPLEALHSAVEDFCNDLGKERVVSISGEADFSYDFEGEKRYTGGYVVWYWK